MGAICVQTSELTQIFSFEVMLCDITYNLVLVESLLILNIISLFVLTLSNFRSEQLVQTSSLISFYLGDFILIISPKLLSSSYYIQLPCCPLIRTENRFELKLGLKLMPL